MEPHGISTSNSSETVRWSLESLELEQRLIAPGEHLAQDRRTTKAADTPEPSSSDIGTQISGEVSHVANQKDEEDTTMAKAYSPIQSQSSHRWILLEWWEEILSITIAIVCTALSIVILIHMNGRSLSEWKLRLQPNTLIALFATITRAALIYPLAECLGHLKWRYFEKPRELAHLQKFDAASRGPLGAIAYLWTLPIKSPLATGAAILMTLLLLFQPFAQQTINFASREAPMANETAHAFRAMKMNKTNLETPFDFAEPVVPALSYNLYKAVSKEATASSGNGHCSTSLCQYADFETLAVCSKCEARQSFNARVNSIFGDCAWQNTNNSRTTNYTVFGLDGVMRNKTEQKNTNDTTMNLIMHEIMNRRFLETLELDLTCGGTGTSVTSMVDPVDTITLHIGKMDRPPSAPIFQLYLFGRSASRHMAEFFVDPTGVDVENMYGSGDPLPTTSDDTFNVCYHYPGGTELKHILSSICLSLTTDIRLWFNNAAPSDQFGVLNYTESRCSLFPCIQRVTGAKLKNNQFTAQYTNSNLEWYGSEMKDSINAIIDEIYCSGHDNECLYSWTPGSLSSVGQWINMTIDTEQFFSTYLTQTNSQGHNFTLLFQKVAEQVSAVLRTQSNPDITNFTGTVYGTEIYVQVNWLWFVLPLVLLASCLIILVLSIWDSSRKDYLFKNNILAAIAFELHGWEPHEYGVDETWTRHSMRNVEKRAERMVARMQLPHEGDGGLRLKRE